MANSRRHNHRSTGHCVQTWAKNRQRKPKCGQRAPHRVSGASEIGPGVPAIVKKLIQRTNCRAKRDTVNWHVPSAKSEAAAFTRLGTSNAAWNYRGRVLQHAPLLVIQNMINPQKSAPASPRCARTKTMGNLRKSMGLKHAFGRSYRTCRAARSAAGPLFIRKRKSSICRPKLCTKSAHSSAVHPRCIADTSHVRQWARFCPCICFKPHFFLWKRAIWPIF